LLVLHQFLPEGLLCGWIDQIVNELHEGVHAKPNWD
jgi:hypothetical protein